VTDAVMPKPRFLRSFSLGRGRIHYGNSEEPQEKEHQEEEPQEEEHQEEEHQEEEHQEGCCSRISVMITYLSITR